MSSQANRNESACSTSTSLSIEAGRGECTRRHLAWTAHYDVSLVYMLDTPSVDSWPECEAGRGQGQGAGVSNKQSKQTNSLSDASATGDSREVWKEEEPKSPPSSHTPSHTHFASTFARFGNSLYGKSFAQDEQHIASALELSQTHSTRARAQSSVAHPKRDRRNSILSFPPEASNCRRILYRNYW